MANQGPTLSTPRPIPSITSRVINEWLDDYDPEMALTFKIRGAMLGILDRGRHAMRSLAASASGMFRCRFGPALAGPRTGGGAFRAVYRMASAAECPSTGGARIKGSRND